MQGPEPQAPSPLTRIGRCRGYSKIARARPRNSRKGTIKSQVSVTPWTRPLSHLPPMTSKSTPVHQTLSNTTSSLYNQYTPLPNCQFYLLLIISTPPPVCFFAKSLTRLSVLKLVDSFWSALQLFLIRFKLSPEGLRRKGDLEPSVLNKNRPFITRTGTTTPLTKIFRTSWCWIGKPTKKQPLLEAFIQGGCSRSGHPPPLFSDSENCHLLSITISIIIYCCDWKNIHFS